MDRYLKKAITEDLNKKIVLISGPRQVGKTTLAKALLANKLDTQAPYYNFDLPKDRKLIMQDQVSFDDGPLILDELHKMKQWKRWLKGHYDTRQSSHPIVVTGSARLDTFKKVGDSMAGRYFQFRLMPLDVKELVHKLNMNPGEALEKLLKLSGFPEPFLADSEKTYRRWQSSHLDIILRQDLPQTENLRSLSSIEVLIEMMTSRVGSVLSYSSLREDLQTDDKSVKRWLTALENNYVFFKLMPYASKIQRALSKAPKYYFFDFPRAESPGARFENLVALALYKEILYRKDVEGENYSLNYLRNTNKNEVDFLICKDKKPLMMIEAKLSENNLTNSFDTFASQLGDIPRIMVVKELHKPYRMSNGVQVVRAADWLAKLDF